MVARYLYLDDESLIEIGPHIDRIGITGKIELEIIHPASLGMDISDFIQRLNDFDGLILDWRLDIIPWERNNSRFPFRAAALAQEIRTRATEDPESKSIPIVLWSTEDKLSQSYYGDETPQDLFDYVFKKEQITDHPEPIRNEMLSLSNGYKKIEGIIKSGETSLARVLNTLPDILDVRLANHFKNVKYPTHEYALFILRELIERPGPLISEELLAARLGIDRDNSPDWIKLLEILPTKSRYQGPFHDAWPRWWAYYIEREWWHSLKGNYPPLGILSAQKQVEIIIEETNLRGLNSASPIKDNYGTKYYTLCEYYQKPLDPANGVIIDEKDPAPWQARRYLSIDAALERRGEPEVKPHPIEIERIAQLRGTRS